MEAKRNPEVEWFFDKPGKWQECYQALRDMVLHCGLTEELKWGCPCYTHQGGNVVLIHGFKEYCALLFMKGALMSDPEGILVQQTANVQSARQLRFWDLEAVTKIETVIIDYLKEALKIEKAGLKVPKKTTSQFEMPEEFETVLTDSPELKQAFYSLTPGRQRGYLLYFSGAKQEKTRIDRINKSIPRILAHKGLDD
nr:YdeI/OmpD-associated family protein [Mucilaginibacter sp. 21P]